MIIVLLLHLPTMSLMDTVNHATQDVLNVAYHSIIVHLVSLGLFIIQLLMLVLRVVMMVSMMWVGYAPLVTQIVFNAQVDLITTA